MPKAGGRYRPATLAAARERCKYWPSSRGHIERTLNIAWLAVRAIEATMEAIDGRKLTFLQFAVQMFFFRGTILGTVINAAYAQRDLNRMTGDLERAKALSELLAREGLSLSDLESLGAAQLREHAETERWDAISGWVLFGAGLGVGGAKSLLKSKGVKALQARARFGHSRGQVRRGAPSGQIPDPGPQITRSLAAP